MKSYIFYIAAALFLLSSCGVKNGREVDKLKAQNDSLMNSKMELEKEVNEYFSAMNDVQENIDKIKTAQNVISVEPLSENTPEDVRTKVTEDMAYINDMIKTNQEELDRLRSKLKNSSFKLADVEKTLASLTKQLNDESQKVAALQVQLQKKDSVITKLGSTVDELGKNVEDLNTQNQEKQTKIQEQDAALHSAWYAIGSIKELKENKIISSNGIFSVKKVLQSDFNKNYFVKVDARNTKRIPLYSASKVTLLTNHPKASYTLEKENENYVLVITDPAEFWSVSKYLVVEVD
ncbi:MAG: hypothetical protein H6Q18_1185 [Bacteroidetes bacterium]|nr:hypothetical protein [Bacteroidota bacterium]